MRNLDELKGKVKDAQGRAERQAAEWRGDTRRQLRGAARQAEGKAQQAMGRMKNAARDIREDLKGEKGEEAEENREPKRHRSAA